MDVSVSVIMPCRDASRTIAHQIEALSRQESAPSLYKLTCSRLTNRVAKVLSTGHI